METVAIIPVRKNSQRVKNKNFRDFYNGKSLLEIKINQIKDSNIFSRVILTSDCSVARDIAKSFNIEFIHRNSEFANATTPWPKVVKHILSQIQGNPMVAWTLVTAPLFHRFNEALIHLTKSKKHDSLIAVLPKKTFLIHESGKGINFNPGLWHPYSQQLETYYEITGSLFMGKKEDMQNWSYWYGPKPCLFPVSNFEAVDIDNEDDFKLAQVLFNSKQ